MDPASAAASPGRGARLIALIAVAAALPISALAVDLSGAISGYLPPDTYRITDDINVPSGQTLTLAPGVVFEFEDSFWEEYEFDVFGTLIAEGAAGNPIIFRAAGGVSEFNYMRIASSSSVMRHCLVENAGKMSAVSEGGLWIDGASPLIEDCEVRSGSWHGIYVTGNGATPTLRRVWSHDNGNDGIDGDAGAGMTLESCVINGNGEDGVCIASGTNTIVNCLIYDNAQDGIDCHGINAYSATLVNCTVGPHPGEGLSDEGSFTAYNCLVVDGAASVGVAKHCLFYDDVSFFGFADAAAGDFRLASGSPAVNYGTRFGPPAFLLPALDLDGNARITGIVDAGAYESATPVDPGTDGEHFSTNLLAPRMGQPVLREAGESFKVLVGLMGSYSSAQASVHLVNPLGETFTMTIEDITAHDLVPGTELELMVYEPGLETLQELTVSVPQGTPADFYGIDVNLGGHHYFSVSAVRVYDACPSTWGFIHITDPHIGYDQETYTATERLRFFVEEANFLNPEFVVVTGDICEDQTLGHDWPQQFLDALSDLKVPAYVLPGNHDHYNVEGLGHNPAGILRYFQEVNRFENSVLEFGDARFYALNTRENLGLLEFYRCLGPTSEALDWVESEVSGLGQAERPRFLLMHGPNYDYFSWNSENAGRVRDIMNAYGFALGLAGHTHRFETYRNEGTNSLGRNDFEHEDDWGRDVAFPGYPLHVQTSSLGKEEHLSARARRDLLAGDLSVPPGCDDPEPAELSDVLAWLYELEESEDPSQVAGQRGLFGDDIGWRWVQVNGTDVSFFTSDTDGDGFRNTEDPWLLGEIRFTLEESPDGTIVSSVQNLHYETWIDVRHYIPADAGIDYLVDRGTLVRRLPDGTAIVAVDSVGWLSTSVVTLIPLGTGSDDDLEALAFRLHPPSPNPFTDETEVAFDLPGACEAELTIHDVSGRLVARLVDRQLQPGRHVAVWHGRDISGYAVANGVYFAMLTANEGRATRKLLLMR